MSRLKDPFNHQQRDTKEGMEDGRTVAIVPMSAVRGGSVDVLDTAADVDGTVIEVLNRSDRLYAKGVIRSEFKGIRLTTVDTHVVAVPRFDFTQMLVEIKTHQSLTDGILLQDDDVPVGDITGDAEWRDGRSWSRQCEREETEGEDGGWEHGVCWEREVVVVAMM